jgi:hypothetical protein
MFGAKPNREEGHGGRPGSLDAPIGASMARVQADTPLARIRRRELAGFEMRLVSAEELDARRRPPIAADEARAAERLGLRLMIAPVLLLVLIAAAGLSMGGLYRRAAAPPVALADFMPDAPLMGQPGLAAGMTQHDAWSDAPAGASREFGARFTGATDMAPSRAASPAERPGPGMMTFAMTFIGIGIAGLVLSSLVRVVRASGLAYPVSGRRLRGRADPFDRLAAELRGH